MGIVDNRYSKRHRAAVELRPCELNQAVRALVRLTFVMTIAMGIGGSRRIVSATGIGGGAVCVGTPRGFTRACVVEILSVFNQLLLVYVAAVPGEFFAVPGFDIVTAPAVVLDIHVAATADIDIDDAMDEDIVRVVKPAKVIIAAPDIHAGREPGVVDIHAFDGRRLKFDHYGAIDHERSVRCDHYAGSRSRYYDCGGRSGDNYAGLRGNHFDNAPAEKTGHNANQ